MNLDPIYVFTCTCTLVILDNCWFWDSISAIPHLRALFILAKTHSFLFPRILSNHINLLCHTSIYNFYKGKDQKKKKKQNKTNKVYLGNYKEFHLVKLSALVALEGIEHGMKWAVICRFLLGKLLAFRTLFPWCVRCVGKSLRPEWGQPMWLKKKEEEWFQINQYNLNNIFDYRVSVDSNTDKFNDKD